MDLIACKVTLWYEFNTVKEFKNIHAQLSQTMVTTSHVAAKQIKPARIQCKLPVS